MAVHFTALRQTFPILQRQVNGQPLAYLDNAATTQRPQVVIDAMNDFQRHHNANVHRGVHALSQEATDLYEGARETARQFVHARHPHEMIFVRGVTEAINLLASSLGRSGQLNADDEILISGLEHHSNIVPWQFLRQQTGVSIKTIPVLDDGSLDQDAFEQALSPHTKVLSINHVSNALGTVNPVKDMIRQAKSVNPDIMCIVDGAQASAHLAVDVQAMGCDAYAISGHKMFAPTGIGALYLREDWMERLPPYQGGGDMILSVRYNGTDFDVDYNELPYKFEAGTPNVVGAIGLSAAMQFLMPLSKNDIHAYEYQLHQRLLAGLNTIDGVRLIGQPQDPLAQVGVQSFAVEGVHSLDLATFMDQDGVAVRAGHHCAMPLMQRFGVDHTIRVSLALSNNTDDIDQCLDALSSAINILRD